MLPVLKILVVIFRNVITCNFVDAHNVLLESNALHLLCSNLLTDVTAFIHIGISRRMTLDLF